MTDPHFNPAEALSLSRAAREGAAVRGTATPWYAPLYGLSMGGIVASLALGRFALVGIAASFALAMVNYLVWSRVTGLRVNNFQGPRTTRVALGLSIVLLAGFVSAAVLRERFGYNWAPLPLGVAVAVFAALGSRLWDRAWLAETREG